jgi:hypothetical protein
MSNCHRETADLRTYDEAMKEIEKKNKTSKKGENK